MIVDFDATLLRSHFDKEGAAGNYKGGFGFHPLCAHLDSGELLAALLRPATPARTPPEITSPSSSGRSRTIPGSDLGREITARADAGGASHDVTHDCHSAQIGFTVGYELYPGGSRGDPEPARVGLAAGSRGRRRDPRGCLGLRS